jgi:hypothetical protein
MQIAVGEKASLMLIIGLMTLAIAMIGFAPTYAAIGIAAPLLVVLARLLQGFSAGVNLPAREQGLVFSQVPSRNSEGPGGPINKFFSTHWRLIGDRPQCITQESIALIETAGFERFYSLVPLVEGEAKVFRVEVEGVEAVL